jgi:hypothetical protein
MQITLISLYSLKSLLKQNVQGLKMVGFTVNQKYSNGLHITGK